MSTRYDLVVINSYIPKEIAEYINKRWNDGWELVSHSVKDGPTPYGTPSVDHYMIFERIGNATLVKDNEDPARMSWVRGEKELGKQDRHQTTLMAPRHTPKPDS